MMTRHDHNIKEIKEQKELNKKEGKKSVYGS